MQNVIWACCQTCPCSSARLQGLRQDLLAGFGPVSIRNMFSGAGVYADGVMFAISVDDTLYLKADEFSPATSPRKEKDPSLIAPRAAARRHVLLGGAGAPARRPRGARALGEPRPCHGVPPRQSRAALLRLDAFEILDDRLDVVRTEHEDRHVGMAGDDAFGERFGKIFDRIIRGKRPEGRRIRVRTVPLLADRMAARAILIDQRLALVDERSSRRL